MPTIEPFVRWAGGKTWLIPHVPQLLGNVHIEHYHEITLPNWIQGLGKIKRYAIAV